MPSTANWATEVGPAASGLLESEFEGTGPSYPDFLLSVVVRSTYHGGRGPISVPIGPSLYVTLAHEGYQTNVTLAAGIVTLGFLAFCTNVTLGHEGVASTSPSQLSALSVSLRPRPSRPTFRGTAGTGRVGLPFDVLCRRHLAESVAPSLTKGQGGRHRPSGPNLLGRPDQTFRSKAETLAEDIRASLRFATVGAPGDPAPGRE